jgi:eukaryotic-like serine/threonine-protein kinase
MVTRTSQPEPPPFAREKVGQLLRGKWHLDALLGAGGMATVYAATHRNGKRGAVKILHRELLVDANARTRFLQEGYAANKVAHAGAVSVLDDDIDDDGCVFLVMELLDGESADARAQQRKGERLDLHEVVQIGDQILDVLAAAHEKGIVHRDIKPENIFLTSDGGLKVLDFGIARIREMSGAPSASLTANGGIMGTPSFMPPEQALGNWSEVGPRTDLWAVGATMFTLLTGRYVHSGETLNQLLLAAMTKPARPIATVVPGVPQKLAEIIDRALAFDADKRWPDARSMQQALRAIPKEQLASSSPLVLAASPSFVPPSGGLVQGVSTVSPLSSEGAPPRRSSAPSLRRYAIAAGAVVAATAVTTFLLLRTGSSAPAVSAGATPSSRVNVVAAAGTTPASTVAPSLSAEPLASASSAAAVATAPLSASASGRPAASAGKTGRAPTTVKTAKPVDPLEKF